MVAPTADGLDGQDLSLGEIGGIFLCQRWPCRVNPTGEATEDIQRPHWPLGLGWPKDENEEDVQNGMLAMPCD